MTNKEKLHERFLRDPLPRRLGGLAATLGRISSSARNSTDPSIVSNLLDEAKHLIEWTAADTEPEIAARSRESAVNTSPNRTAPWESRGARTSRH